MVWLRSNWLRAVAPPALLGLARACWLWLWLETLRDSVAASEPAPLLPVHVLALAYLASFAVARLLLSGRLPLRAARLLEALAGLVAIALMVWQRFYGGQYAPWDGRWLVALGQSLVGWEGELPGAIIVLPVVIYVWLRGVLDAGSNLYRDDVWGAFTAGFAIIALAGVTSVVSGRALPAGAHDVVFLFFAAGLAALAFASLESSSAMAARRGDQQVRFDRYWLISVGSVIAAMLLAGVVISALITPEAVARMLRWTTAVLDVLGLALYYVVLVFAYSAFLFLEPLLRLAERALSGSRQQQTAPMETPGWQQQLEEIPRGQATLPGWLSHLLPWLGLLAVILIVGLAFAIALRRLQKADDDEPPETRESILTRSLLQEQLGGLSRRLRRRRLPLLTPFLSLEGEEGTRRIIRSVYQSLLAAARAHGLARRRAETPTEYLAGLAGRWPDEESNLDTLTRAYEKARYGRAAPSDEEATAARQAWDGMQPAIAPGEGQVQPTREAAP